MSIVLDTKKKALLIVEDESDLSALLKDALEHEGYRIVQSFKLSDAISRLTNQRFAAILVDYKLPGGTGEEIIRTMRGPGQLNRETPVIVMSGYLEKDLLERMIPLAQHFLVKPFKSKELVTRVREVAGEPLGL